MVDRTSKILLLLIAGGLWANVFVARLTVAKAEEDYGDVLASIASDLSSIEGGSCANRKIC